MRRNEMFQTILNFAMQLSLVYLLTAMFIILDLLLLSVRTRRLRHEKMARERQEAHHVTDEELQRQAFEGRQTRVGGAH